RRESPNWPRAGAMNAPVLNQFAIVGSEGWMGCPVKLARSVPLVPRAMSVKAPSTRAVDGEAGASCTPALDGQSPKKRWRNPADDAQPGGRRIGRPQQVEPRALRAGVAGVDHQRALDFLLPVEVPRLHVAEPVVRVYAEIVRHGAGPDAGKAVLQRERLRARGD